MDRYILTIFNKSIYREIEIPKNARLLKIGTNKGSDFVLDDTDFFEPVNLTLVNKDGWQMICSENLYVAEDVTKLLVKKLEHRTEFDVYYQSSEKPAFSVIFKANFAAENHSYGKVVDISSKNIITIGGHRESDIVLQTPYTKNVSISFEVFTDGLRVKNITGNKPLSINGKDAENGALIKETDFFSIEDCFFYFKDGKIRAEDKSDVIPRLHYGIAKAPTDYPKFTRNTRIKTIINEDPIEILDPPNKPEKPKNNLVIRLLPSLGMLIAAGFMVRMGGYMIAFSLISAIMAIVTTVATIIEDKKDYKKSSAERITKYNAYIDNKKTEIEAARNKERENLEEVYISSDKELYNFKKFSPDLFDRNKVDEDFLCIRLGNGSVEARRKIDYKKQERLEVEDDLQELPIKLSQEFKYVQNAPVVCNLSTAGAIGVYGEEEFRYEFYKKIITDIVARHYQNDVKIALIADKKHINWLTELRFLPHLSNPITGQRNIACDEDSKTQLYEYLYAELESRNSKADSDKKFDYNIVIFFIDEFGFKTHPISKYVEDADKLGVSFVFFEELQEKLPQGCSYIIAPNGETAKLIDSSDRNNAIAFNYTLIPDDELSKIMNLLAPVYSEELSLEGNLTKSLSLFDLLEVFSAEDLNLDERWSASQAVKSLSAPIGVSGKGTLSLDLSDKADGPHGLVAGTTGSGKSETILTYILSMATLFHPYEVGFVIIDFKGGGMANQLEELPHLIGTITNIDGKEIDRSLKSIKAELQKRQKLFKLAKVNHIDAYINKFKNGEVEIPLPHLIIIVDEFAELKAEQPEFMKELISAARIGRSLGVHLILSTQKPAGQVDDQIWSNSRFKLCLKVQSAEDSKEVIKSPLAAEIKEPGRAYLQIGNNEVFELFQSGYSGAPGKVESNIKEFKIHEIKKNGQRSLLYSQKKPHAEDETTQLTSVVRHIKKHVEDNNIKKLPPICLPPLDKSVPFPNKLTRPVETGIIAEIGKYDDPDNQVQSPFSINLTNENVMIIGSAQTGKTNLIQDIIKGVSAKYTSEEVNFYIVDFASMFLKSYEELKHVGGVVVPQDDERIKNLIKLLRKEMVIRKEKLLNAGVSSYSSYLESGGKDIPQIILIIDNLTVLKEMYFEEEDDDLLSICRDGLSLGINVIVANSVSSNFGYKYLSNFARKIALFNNDSGEYASLFDHCRETLPDIKGRALIDIDKEYYECQTFLAFEGEKEIDKLQHIKNFIKTVNSRNEKEAVRIPEVPDLLDSVYIESNFDIEPEEFALPIGLSYGSVEPLTLRFADLSSPLVLSGRDGMGKDGCLKYIVKSLQTKWPGGSVTYIIDNMNKELEEFKDSSEYSILFSKAEDYIKEIQSIAAERYEVLSRGDDLDLSKEPLLLLIINNRDSIESISKDIEACEAYINLVNRYKSMKVCIIVGQFDNSSITFASPEVSRMIGEAGHFLFFEDLNSIKAAEVPFGMQKTGKKLSYSDAYYFKNGEVERIKTTSK